MHVEDLTLAQELAADRLGGRRLVELADVGEDRTAGRRRGVDHRQVTDSGQRHLEGPRDGVGGEGEDVDRFGQRLDRLLVGDPEALLLVDDQQAELLEAHVVPEQAVGTDHHVDRPVGQAGKHLFGLGAGEEAAQHLDPDREGRVAVGEGLGVLARKQRGRHEHRGLVAVLHRLEGGSDRDLGLAEADVAADQPVHGARLLHVGLHLFDRPQLIGGLDEGERGLELGLPGRVGTEGVALDLETPAVQGHELLGDLVDRGARLGARSLPLRPAEPADRGRVAAGIGSEEVDLIGGEVELVARAVLEQQVVAGRTAHGAGDHASVPCNAVLAVDDEVAGREVVEESVDRPGTSAGLPVRPTPAGHVGLGHHRDPTSGEHETAVERSDDEAARRGW